MGSGETGLGRMEEPLSETDDDDEAMEEEEADILAQISGLRGETAGTFNRRFGELHVGGGGRARSVAEVAQSGYEEYDTGQQEGYYDEEADYGEDEQGYGDEYGYVGGYYEGGEEEYDGASDVEDEAMKDHGSLEDRKIFPGPWE